MCAFPFLPHSISHQRWYGSPRNRGQKFCGDVRSFKILCPETCGDCLEETTTTAATTTTVPEATTTTVEAEKAETTATTVSSQAPGLTCEADDQCESGVCKTHCCATSDACDACSNQNDDGQCYAPLAIRSGWNPDSSLTKGWRKTYNKGERYRVAGPTAKGTDATWLKSMIAGRKFAPKRFKFRLLWESPNAKTSKDYVGASPLDGLLPPGQGADPGLFEVDGETGEMEVIPRRNGEYTVYLIAEDKAGSAATNGLARRLDQVVVKKWSFTVAGKPYFAVKSFSRTKDGLDDVNVGDSPYVTRDQVGAVEATIGTTYHIAPIDYSSLKFEHASGGEDAKIKFTFRNQPPGFFIDPETGEIQGTPKPVGDGDCVVAVGCTSAGGAIVFATELLAVDPGGSLAVLEPISITLLARPLFNAVFKKERTATSSGYADPSAAAQKSAPFRVGQSYRIATLTLDAAASTVSAGNFGDISYTLSPDAINSFFVQASSGDIFGTFPRAGTFSFAVIAVDQAGATSTVEQLQFKVLPRPSFSVALGTNRVRPEMILQIQRTLRFALFSAKPTGSVRSG